MQTFDGALANLNQTAERSVEQNINLKDSVSKVGLGFVSAASEALSLWTQYDNLKKLELGIATAKNLDFAKRNLIVSQAAFDELATQRITSGAEYGAAALRLVVAQVGGENMNRFAIKIDKVADSVVADARRMEKALAKVGGIDVGDFLADPRGESKSSKASSLGGTERSITVIINMDGKQIAKYFSDFAGDTIKFV